MHSDKYFNKRNFVSIIETFNLIDIKETVYIYIYIYMSLKKKDIVDINDVHILLIMI